MDRTRLRLITDRLDEAIEQANELGEDCDIYSLLERLGELHAELEEALEDDD